MPTKNSYPLIFDICHCGKCNEIVWGGKKYISGHNSYGKYFSLDTRMKISKANTGRQRTEEFKNFISKIKTGVLLSDEHKRKISEGNKNKVIPLEVRKKISKSHSGKKISDETKLKLSIINTGKIGYWKNKILSNDHRNKISKNHADLSGKNNPRWLGGISYFPYCSKFNNQLKEKIRERDNRICQKCGKTEKENNKKLSVHHIHYDKENCYPDLICICNNCHSKVNSNRTYWEEYFMNLLKERNLLNYFGD